MRDGGLTPHKVREGRYTGARSGRAIDGGRMTIAVYRPKLPREFRANATMPAGEVYDPIR
jgi:hypothetical protein